jgi:hypothetical protein
MSQTMLCLTTTHDLFIAFDGPAVSLSWQMLNCLLILFSAAMSQTMLCLFPLSKVFFVGATSLVLQKTLLTIFMTSYIRSLVVAHFDLVYKAMHLVN